MLKHMEVARGYIGVAEIRGPHHNPKIVQMWKDAHVKGVKDDETPWCAAFVSAVLEEAGIVSARTGWARSYLNWGQRLDLPRVGAVVVFERGPNAGHVGFIVGKNSAGNLMVLGANQGDAVNIKPFFIQRVLGYRWPKELDLTLGAGPLPVVRSDGKLSTNEA